MSATSPVSSPFIPTGNAVSPRIMGVQSEKRHFACKLEDFESMRKCKQLIDAQKFHFEIGHSIGLPTTWSFYMRAEKKDGDDNNDHRDEDYEDEDIDSVGSELSVGAFFRLVEQPEEVKDVYASFKFSIKKVNGDAFFVDEGSNEIINMAKMRRYGWGQPRLVDEDEDLTDVIEADGSLTIEVEFTLFSKVPSGDHWAEKVKAFEVQSREQLSKDLGQILTMGEDVNGNGSAKIISKDNQEFPVIRGVLAARSAVFLRMFQAKMTESETGVVNIADLSGKTVNVLLHYLCSGTLHQDWKSPEVIEELTAAAHRYELHLLTAFLDDVLGTVCIKDNAMRLAILAKTLGMKKAEKELFDFVKKNATSLEDFMAEPAGMSGAPY